MQLEIGTIIGIAVSAACLAHTAAQRRNREAGVWAVLCFLCPLALLVIWSLDYREPPQARYAPTAVTPPVSHIEVPPAKMAG
jgi:hypothetical protein